MNAIRIVIASALITAVVIKGGPAAAGPPATSDVSVSIVRTADLDLSTPAGKRMLDQRLVQAAREVCGPASDVDLAGKNAVRACRSSVLAEARSRSEQLASRSTPLIIAAR